MDAANLTWSDWVSTLDPLYKQITDRGSVCCNARVIGGTDIAAHVITGTCGKCGLRIAEYSPIKDKFRFMKLMEVN